MASYKKDTDIFLEDPEIQVVQAFEINDGLSTNEHTIGYHTKCFGLCCDFRKAVLVVNAIEIVIKILEMAGIAFFAIAYIFGNFDDDAFSTSDDTKLAVAFLEIFEMMGLCFSCIAIYGALKFKRWAITTALVYYSLILLYQLVDLFMGFGDVLGLIMYGLFVYPHFYMIRLMRAGIMTKSNYPNIAQCCEC